MSRLTLLLVVKILFTILAVVIPFLFLPAERVAEMTGASIPAPSLYRLYGVAMVAILTGYAFAIPIAQRGERPLGPLVMGVISNGGAAFVLFSFGAEGTSRILAIVFAILAILLALSILKPEFMLKTMSGSAPRGALDNDRAAVRR